MVPGWVSPDDITTLLRQAPTGTRFIFNAGAMENVEQAKAWLQAGRKAVLTMQGGLMKEALAFGRIAKFSDIAATSARKA